MAIININNQLVNVPDEVSRHIANLEAKITSSPYNELVELVKEDRRLSVKYENSRSSLDKESLIKVWAKIDRIIGKDAKKNVIVQQQLLM